MNTVSLFHFLVSTASFWDFTQFAFPLHNTLFPAYMSKYFRSLAKQCKESCHLQKELKANDYNKPGSTLKRPLSCNIRGARAHNILL